MPGRLLLVCALILAMPGLVASEAIDRALAQWDSNVKSARDKQGQADERSRDKAIKNLRSAAITAGRRSDIEATQTCWKEILRLDYTNEDARNFFTAAGNLDATLAEINTARDILGRKTTDLSKALGAEEKICTIGAQPGLETSLGALRAGSRLSITYVDGSWNPRVGSGNQSPDDANFGLPYRLVIAERAGNASTRPVVVVPPGTAAKTFEVTLDRDLADAVLAIQPPAKPNNMGTVTYKIVLLRK